MVSLVMIHWEDSRQPNGTWRWLTDLPPPSVVRCASVGWLVHDGAHVKQLAPNMGDLADDTMQCSGVIQIPTSCILRIDHLREPKPPRHR